jgi:transcriptional regulator with XRE-family HTH domain
MAWVFSSIENGTGPRTFKISDHKQIIFNFICKCANIFSIFVLNILAMSKIAKNISVLRALKKLSQTQLADELDISRSRLGSYEEGRAEPPYDLLIKIADHFHIAIDALVRGDLAKTDPESLLEIGKNRILFPVIVDRQNQDMVEVVPAKAVAGYLTGYADPEFMEDLPIMKRPSDHELTIQDRGQAPCFCNKRRFNASAEGWNIRGWKICGVIKGNKGRTNLYRSYQGRRGCI